MTLYRYPQNDFDRPDVLLNLLGSFWATTYQGNKLLDDLTAATGQLAQQSYLQLLELLNSISRANVPLYHQDNWYALTLNQSQLNPVSRNVVKFATPTSYEYQTPTTLAYGVPQAAGDYYSVEKPADLVESKAIFNRLTEPTVSLLQGVDYTIDAEAITFRENPFENNLIPKRYLLSATGEVLDTQLVLWVYRGKWDWKYVYEQFGYALRLNLVTSENYKQFINAIFDAFNSGTAIVNQQAALSAAFGVPLTVETTETVEVVVQDDLHLNIITDQHVYQFPKAVSAIVSAGQTLKAGDPLTDVLQIFEFNQGQDVSASDISALAVGPEILAWGFYGDITFSNKETALNVELDVDGYTKVSWELGGFPYDVEKFWDDVHAAGVAKNETLAMLLDVRENPIGQPTAASLPSTINPLLFLTGNLLRNNAYVVKTKAYQYLPNKLAFVPVEQLRKIQPPQTLMLMFVELVYADAPVIMEAPGTELNPGYEEEVSGFACMATADSIDPGTFVTETVRITRIGGRCI